jgi:germination protein, Ger(x)C family
MTPRKKRLAAVLGLVLIMTTLPGCWDSHELDAMLIITGIALDKSSNPDQMDITVQIGETKQGSSGSGEANSQEDSTILLKATSNTMLSGIMEINRDSSHKLLLHHNQILLLGSSLAEQGVEKRIDLLMRDQQARMEVPVMVVDGQAGEALSAQLEQDKISGVYLARMLDGLFAIAPAYKVRLLDFASRLLDETTAPVAPMITLTKNDQDKQEVKFTGMAVFRGDRMVGRLNVDESAGYAWSMGKVKQATMEVGSDQGKAVYHIAALNCRREVTLRPDGGVRVALSADATLDLDELSGFDKMTSDALMSELMKTAQEEIQRKITGSFDEARRLDADIYGFGTSVYRKYPKEWKTMKNQWDKIFPNIELSVQAKVRISATGQIGHSLEMEGNKS